MKNLPHLLISIIVGGWAIAIAIIAVQNATPVSLKFLFFQSIEIPLGVVLALSAALGTMGTAILQPLWSSPQIEARENRDPEAFKR
jgi:uncharacterized integral membrane protein